MSTPQQHLARLRERLARETKALSTPPKYAEIVAQNERRDYFKRWQYRATTFPTPDVREAKYKLLAEQYTGDSFRVALVPEVAKYSGSRSAGCARWGGDAWEIFIKNDLPIDIESKVAAHEALHVMLGHLVKPSAVELRAHVQQKYEAYGPERWSPMDEATNRREDEVDALVLELQRDWRETGLIWW